MRVIFFFTFSFRYCYNRGGSQVGGEPFTRGGNVKLALIGSLVFSVACMKTPSSLLDAQVRLAPQTKELRGESEEVLVISRDLIEETDLSLEENDLLVGFAPDLLRKSYHWGASVIAIEAGKNQGLSMLKLASTPSFNVRLQAQGSSLQLLTREGALMAFPILGRSGEKLVVDFESLGANLNLFELLTKGRSGYKVQSNQTVTVSYQAPNLTFDVETRVVSEDDSSDTAKITTRWFLLENKGVSSSFQQRLPAAGVGFFLSQENSAGTLRVFDLYEKGSAEIQVYAKNFPEVMKVSVEAAIAEWNDVFERVSGLRPIRLEYIDYGHPLSQIIMAGDPRFNVIEWDIFNLARYEGFGPCISDQENGKTMGCSSMIQGPAITYRTAQMFGDMSLIDRVFGLQPDSQQLRFTSTVKDLQLSTGKVRFNVHAFDPTLRDEHIAHEMALEHDHEHGEDLDGANQMLAKTLLDLPDMDPLLYLQSYIQSVVAHEFGHNLGLRHNFKGSLFATAERRSASVMDYLFTYTEYDLKVEEYDEMAVAYAYTGRLPARQDMFCTDHEVYSKENPRASIDCRRFDYSAEPLSFYSQLTRLLLDNSLNGDAQNSLRRTAGFLNFALEGIAGYAVNAYLECPSQQQRRTGQSFAAMQSTIQGELKSIRCSFELATQAFAENPAVQENLKIFGQMFARNTYEFLPAAFGKEQLACN